MHDDSARQGTEIRKADPLHHAPPPGGWVLWHGPQAQALLDAAQAQGQTTQTPANLPPLPPGFPPQNGTAIGNWLLVAGGQRYFIHGESHGQYVSCFVCNLSQAG